MKVNIDSNLMLTESFLDETVDDEEEAQRNRRRVGSSDFRAEQRRRFSL